MKLTRPTRFLAALVTLFCLLFTQLAVAAYACPGASAMTAAVSSGAMPGCEDMDMDTALPQPGLCTAHCEAGHQSFDTPAAPLVHPFVAATLSLVIAADSRQHAPAALPDASRQTRTTAPPLIIRNCCFRI